MPLRLKWIVGGARRLKSNDRSESKMKKHQENMVMNISLAIEELTDTYNSISSQGKEVELSVAIKNLAKAFRVVAETMIEQEETLITGKEH